MTAPAAHTSPRRDRQLLTAKEVRGWLQQYKRRGVM